MSEDKIVNLEGSASASLNASASAFIIPSPFSELKDKKEELLDSIGDFEYFGNFLTEKKDELAVFFLIGKEMLEDFGTELATKEIIQVFDNESINESHIFKEKNADEIYDDLRCYKVISKDEKKKAEKIINIRSSIAHNPKSRYNHERFSNFESLEKEIKDAMEILEKMKEKVEES